MLTERLVKSLKPPESGHHIVWDNSIRGLGIRITSNNVIAFVLNFNMRGGPKRRYTIGRWPEWSVAAARDEALRLRLGIDKGEDPMEERRDEFNAPTMNELARDYLEKYAVVRKAKRSVEEDRRILAGVIQPRLGTLRVHAVTKREIEALHASRKATPFMANRIVALLSKMFSLAVEWGWRPDNPCHGIKCFREDRREHWLAEDELVRFVAALDAHADQNVADCFRLLLLTGSRKGEALKADWTQFDLERAYWIKPARTTKQGRMENVPLNAEALELLRRMKEQGGGEGYLFPSAKIKGRPLATLERSWRAVCKAAGLSGVRLHDLRHSFASTLVSSGVSLHIVGKLLGHTQASTTARYAHLSGSSLRDAADVMGEVFRKASPKK
jgi:integrase